ncbi:organic solvent tolerance protein OstA [Capnocytophaga cynodegmi]|uniref:Organic solvent tolerance protein OstA n=2 Tax=Capnocytophaga cynodegmi TaxID=28189 RepID=A0A250E8V1_9FLAO|nr:putative LPS assembly protein LptD [Capnocytophaga cynodegmi]ATA69372.1 organic solvent tolerance protein OstA [Capnocytophaga cynodegmi]
MATTCFWYAELFAIRKMDYRSFHTYSILDTLRRSRNSAKDTIKKQNIKPQTDSLLQKADSLRKDSLQKPKGALEDIVKYKAKDSIVFNKVKSEIILYNETQVQYTDIDISAGIELIKFDIGEVYAGRLKDSVGEYTQHPVFKQGDDVIEPDSIRFNYKTQRAIIRNAYTKQDENNIKGEIIKKENDSTYFMKNAIITTAEDLDDPDYYILLRKAKFVPQKKIVAGFSNMYIVDVPTPIAIPFAYYPMVSGRSSGLIFPTFGEANNRGYFVQNGGYYFVISDHLDLALTGDYFTNGSYGFRAQSAYNKRYKFSGNFSLNYENQIYSIKGLPDYSGTTLYNIQWTHSKDAKSNPNSSFSASVNLGSSRYYQNSYNQINSPNVLNNTLSSSISYSKTFPAYPSVNLSVTASHSQNTNTQSIEMTLPALRANMERIYPFVKQGQSKRGLLKSLNFQYSMQADNRFSTTDSLFFSKKMFNDAKNGVRHSIPVSTTTKLFKYVTLGLNSSLNETWQFKTIRKNDFNSNIGASKIDTLNGFDRFLTYNLGASLGTTVYGTFRFKKDAKIQAIRHVMRPSVSYGYTPAFDQYYEDYISDAFGNKSQYTRFEGGIYGVPGLNKSQSISFSLSNTLEAKVKQKDSTETEPKKIMLLNSLNFSSSYNVITKQFSPVSVTGGTSLFEGKLPINFGMTLNPYAIDENGRQMEKFNINNGGSLFRLTNANLSTSYTFSNRDKNKTKNNDNRASGGRADDLFGSSRPINDMQDKDEETEEQEDKNEKKSAFYNASIPWDVNLAYSLTYSNVARESKISNNSIMFSSNVELSPKWQVGISSGYDFINKGITYTQLRFERDLNSFRMSFHFTPIGYRNSWYFFIGIKSSMLSDLKWDKSKEPDRRLR